MRDVLAGILIGLFFLVMWSPESVGRDVHEFYNQFMKGWESVK
jgi:hypothetical protein